MARGPGGGTGVTGVRPRFPGEQEQDTPAVGEIRDGQIAVPGRGSGKSGTGKTAGPKLVGTDSSRGRQFLEQQTGGTFIPESGGSPSEKRAKLARNQFDRYMDTFAPVEDRLLDFTLDQDAGLKGAVSDASKGVGQSFESQREQTQRGLSRFGAGRSASEQASSRRQSLLREASAGDQARNSARRDVEDRRLSLLAGGLNTSNPRPNR